MTKLCPQLIEDYKADTERLCENCQAKKRREDEEKRKGKESGFLKRVLN
jgi:hypothetical protein